jgi:hypothetical protein
MSRRSEAESAKAEKRKPQAKDEIYFYCCCEIYEISESFVIAAEVTSLSTNDRPLFAAHREPVGFFSDALWQDARDGSLWEAILGEAPRQFFVA